MKKLCLVVLALFLCSSVFGATLAEGVAAYKNKDYPAAFKIIRELAEQGDADAQNNLGNMYDQGDGVTRDYKEAAKWFRMAAEQGNALAQYHLGILYANGEGVTKGYIQAHMWFTLSCSGGNEDAGKNCDKLAEKLAPFQIKEAKRLAKEKAAEIEEKKGGKVE